MKITETLKHIIIINHDPLLHPSQHAHLCDKRNLYVFIGLSPKASKVPVVLSEHCSSIVTCFGSAVYLITGLLPGPAPASHMALSCVPSVNLSNLSVDTK
jgi:hypothetical protein